jgi:hypothetical protein
MNTAASTSLLLLLLLVVVVVLILLVVVVVVVLILVLWVVTCTSDAYGRSDHFFCSHSNNNIPSKKEQVVIDRDTLTKPNAMLLLREKEH